MDSPANRALLWKKKTHIMLYLPENKCFQLLWAGGPMVFRKQRTFLNFALKLKSILYPLQLRKGSGLLLWTKGTLNWWSNEFSFLSVPLPPFSFPPPFMGDVFANLDVLDNAAMTFFCNATSCILYFVCLAMESAKLQNRERRYTIRGKKKQRENDASTFMSA